MSESNAAEFVTGESNPYDFVADAVLEHLAASDATEVDRVLALEGAPDGKNRVSVLNYATPAAPTAPTPETLAASDTSDAEPEPQSEPTPVPLDGPQIGDLETEPTDLPEGYAAVVVSTDGMPTKASEAAEAAKVEEPLVY